jgi:hypothetical protein
MLDFKALKCSVTLDALTYLLEDPGVCKKIILKLM